MYNENQHDFSLASKYLNDREQRFVGMTLGELIENKDKLNVQEEVKNLNELSEYLSTLNKIESVLELSTPRQKVLAKLVKDSIEKLDSIFQEIEQTKKIEEPYEKRRKKQN